MKNTKMQEMSEILDLKAKKENCTTEINKLKLEIEKEKGLLKVLKEENSAQMQVWSIDLEIKKNNVKMKKNKQKLCKQQKQLHTFHHQNNTGGDERVPREYFQQPDLDWSRHWPRM